LSLLDVDEPDKGKEERLLVAEEEDEEATNGDEDSRLLLVYMLLDSIPSLSPYAAEAGAFCWRSKTEAVDADNNLFRCLCIYAEE
jgi:hypothetical protein